MPHTLVMGNLLSTDQSTLYLDANSGFDVNLPITVVAVVATRLGNDIVFKDLGPPPLLSLDSNGVTIKYNGTAADVPTSSARFIQADPRGTGLEWFAVVKDGMKSAIYAYASGTNGPFTPPGQSAVPFNNIVTTLMTDFSSTFVNKNSFNQAIGAWDTANVTNMQFMFNATSFNQPIGSWNTSNVTSMFNMFDSANKFNQPIGLWNTSNVKNMERLFSAATVFNQPIGSWNTANVTNMTNMFIFTSFNQPIDSWNTASVRDMSNMFFSATAFNQPIGSWNTANVTTMPYMFNSATVFNQPINTWNVANVSYFIDFRTASALSTENTPPKFR